MIVNANSDRRMDIDTYFNGKKVSDCIYADDTAGVVWMIYRDSQGTPVADFEAEPGSFFYETLQVIKLQGRVEVKVKPLEGETEAQARAAAEMTSAPLRIYFFA